MKILNFRRLYHRISEHDEGYAIHSIVAYKKRPYTFERITSPMKNGMVNVETRIKDYKYGLYIDLWLLTLTFNWIAK